ncbi:MAG: hypothetical protein AAF384_18605, partial [Pseudomonadota bacterium]
MTHGRSLFAFGRLVVMLLLASNTIADTKIPTEHFAALPSFASVELSPDGGKIAAIRNIRNDSFTGKVILVQDLSTLQRRIAVTLADG